MVVLAIDTSHPEGCLSLGVDGRVPGSTRFGAETSHLAELGPAVDGLLRQHDVTIEKVDRVALVIGPGSFTGLRIGLAFAKGLYAALGVELVTMGTLELLAAPWLSEHTRVGVMVDARKGEVYAAVYGGDPAAPVTEVSPHVTAPEAFVRSLTGALLVGSGVARYGDIVGAAPHEPNSDLPSTEHLARRAPELRPLSRRETLALEPWYIRPSDAQLGALRPVDPGTKP